MPHAKLWRGMATTTASLLILSLGTSAIADSRAGFLNAQLGTRACLKNILSCSF